MTKRWAVSSGRLRYPLATPAPPTTDLAGDADGDRLAAFVEQANVEVGDRFADHAAASGLDVGAGDGAVGDVDGGLGDAVHVDEPRPGIAVALDPGLERLQLQRLAAEDDLAQRIAGGGFSEIGLDQLAEGGRGLVEDGDALARPGACGRLRDRG